MRLAFHVQTVPMGLRSDTGSLTPPTGASPAITPDLACPLRDPNSTSCLREVQTISQSPHILPMPSLTRLTTGGVLNPTKNTTNTSHNKLPHQEPLQPPPEPRRLTPSRLQPTLRTRISATGYSSYSLLLQSRLRCSGRAITRFTGRTGSVGSRSSTPLHSLSCSRA